MCHRSCTVGIVIANDICAEKLLLTALLCKIRKRECPNLQSQVPDTINGRVYRLVNWNADIINVSQHYKVLTNKDWQFRQEPNAIHIFSWTAHILRNSVISDKSARHVSTSDGHHIVHGYEIDYACTIGLYLHFLKYVVVNLNHIQTVFG